jgi:hypothetical protein
MTSVFFVRVLIVVFFREKIHSSNIPVFFQPIAQTHTHVHITQAHMHMMHRCKRYVPMNIYKAMGRKGDLSLRMTIR